MRSKRGPTGILVLSIFFFVLGILSGLCVLHKFIGETPTSLFGGFDVPPGHIEFQRARDVNADAFPSVDISVQDFLSRASVSPLPAIVAYGETTANSVGVDYWLARTDIPGTFYHAQGTKFPVFSFPWEVGSVELVDNNRLEVHPKHPLDSTATLFFCVCSLGSLVLGAFCNIEYWRPEMETKPT